MNHYQLHNLTEEPFSNSPNPDFFFRVPGRLECLDLLEISIRLRRGLSIVLGEVGTGKSTLCRQLVRRLGGDDSFRVHALLDPQFTNAIELLKVLHAMFLGKEPSAEMTVWKLKEAIKNELFRQSVEQNAIVTLLVDEAQKIRDDSLELLRELLNYETNENKLLQIVLFGQTEFQETLRRFPNFIDRVDAIHTLKPLSLRETKSMIRYRLDQVKGEEEAPELFTWSGYWVIHRASGGYPRKILNLCHRVHLEMILRGKQRANGFFVNRCRSKLQEKTIPASMRALRIPALALAGCFAAALAFHAGLFTPDLADSSLLKAGRVAERAYSGAAGSDPIVLAEVEKGKGKEISTVSTQRAPQPEMLGELLLVSKEALSRAISRVYGVYHERFMQRVLAANPDIGNPNHIAAGSSLRFPRIDTVRASDAPNAHWVVAGEFDSLEAAFAMLCTSAYRDQALRILSYSSPETGLRFAIVANRFFPDASAAQQMASRLPNPIRSRTVVRNQWPSETVFFTAPDAWGLSQNKKNVLASSH
jgi:type II secretory pathway predicted ATPase ExeA